MRALLSRAASLLILGRMFEASSANEERAGLDWWAFQEVERPEVPVVGGHPNPMPIDAFVRARLQEAEMSPAPRATRRTLIRRLHFDLTGVPPTAEEVEQFLAESSEEEAYRKLVDRLLASDRFGERWARHWLDVVRYAETNGYERDAVKPDIWKYRDWVIEAFNSDMPYDEFVREQIAGDEMEKRTESSVIATGMLRAGTWNDEPNDPQEYKYERLEDLVDVVTTAFLGLTVKCARCHDHKFDPIPQRDYYRIAAAFWPGAVEPRDGNLMGGPSESELGFKGVFGWTDVRHPAPPMHLLVNGDPHRRGEEVTPGHLSLVAALDQPLAAAPPGAKTSHRREQLAEFIVDRRNPLTARVMVNRIWQNLFGVGIVATPNNFGFKAAPPTHPELLDWLAADFMDGGWKVKSLIGRVVMSETYRQSSVHPREAEYAERDSANRLWWKMNRRRADAEALRDAMLHASGELNLKMGGPSFYPVMAPEVLEGFSRKASAWTPSPESERLRRSVYMVSKRHLLPPLMTAFDFPNSERPCGRRDVTTVAPQALAMMNNHFVHARSERLARSVVKETDDLADLVQSAWRMVLKRDPTWEEAIKARNHYAEQIREFTGAGGRKMSGSLPRDHLSLWLVPGKSSTLDSAGRLERWRSITNPGREAVQPEPERRPRYVEKGFNGKPVIRFSGRGEYLRLPGPTVNTQECTILAVGIDHSRHGEHREILSNWDGQAGNSVTSLFLGLTGEGVVRFSDDFRSDRPIPGAGKPFVLSASTGPAGVEIVHNGRMLASRPHALAVRNLGTPFVIGQQGNIDGEYWEGELATLIIYEQQLGGGELWEICKLLAAVHGIEFPAKCDWAQRRDPRILAIASVCHVLLNSNEFLYVD